MPLDAAKTALQKIDELETSSREHRGTEEQTRLLRERAALIAATCKALLEDPEAAAIARQVREINTEVEEILNKPESSTFMLGTLLRYPGQQFGDPNALSQLLEAWGL